VPTVNVPQPVKCNPPFAADGPAIVQSKVRLFAVAGNVSTIDATAHISINRASLIIAHSKVHSPLYDWSRRSCQRNDKPNAIAGLFAANAVSAKKQPGGQTMLLSSYPAHLMRERADPILADPILAGQMKFGPVLATPAQDGSTCRLVNCDCFGRFKPMPGEG
jgi:hypothetical protein